MKLNRIIALVIALALMGTVALAMPVKSTDGTLTLSCAKGNETLTVEVPQFELLGVGADGKYLVYTDQGYLSLVSIMQALSQDEIAKINEMDAVREAEIAPLAKGDKGDEVRKFQTALVKLGYLKGNADGDFGNMTETAIIAFQQALGLEQTGVADARLQMLAESMIATELVLESKGAMAGTPLDSVAEEEVSAMQAIYDSGLQLDFDDITGIGFLSDDSTITYEVPGENDLDQYALTLQFGMRVREEADGSTSIDPAVKVSCLCVRRPVIEELTLKTGNYRGTYKIEELNAVLNGVKTEETGIAILDDETVEALAKAEDVGELKIRVSGRYNSFDIAVGADQLGSVTKIGDLGKRLEEIQKEDDAQ